MLKKKKIYQANMLNYRKGEVAVLSSVTQTLRQKLASLSGISNGCELYLFPRLNLYLSISEVYRSASCSIRIICGRKWMGQFFVSQLLSCVRLFCSPIDRSLPGSSVHGILQARVLERVAISFSRGSSRPRDRTCISCNPGRFFTAEPPRKFG